jgi:spermidine synthase
MAVCMTSLDLPVAGKAAHPRERQSLQVRVLCVLFFFSGFPALIYQLTWQRELFLIFGVNIESVTIVVTAFMLGLGFGSLAGGWLTKRRRMPLLLVLASIEALTAAFGLTSLTIFHKVGTIAIGLSLPATAAASLALVIAPTLLMGATLPLLVGHLAQRSGHTGGAVGLFYYVNTLGAAAACYACAFLLFPFAGMSGAIHVAGAINGAVALGALGAHILQGQAPSTTEELNDTRGRRAPALRFGLALLLAAAGGFVSLSYEIFFFRTISYATASSATAFALTLGMFLTAIASGARTAGEQCRDAVAIPLTKRLVDPLLLACLCGALFLPLLGHVGSFGNVVLLSATMVMVYIIARLWGLLLPYLAEMSIAADAKAGMRTAQLYLANILGSASGAVLTGFVLMNVMGLTEIAIALVLIGVAVTLLLIATTATSSRDRLRRAGSALAIGVLTAVAVPSLSAHVLENVFWKGSPLAQPLPRVVENRSGIITVAADGTVFGNGIYDGHFNVDLKNDSNGIVRPYALSLFHPAPRDVLMIGLSSGSWAQVIASNPDVKSLTVVEINPGYVSLIEKEPQVASILSNAKVRIVTDDGRRWLRGNPDRRFDVVVSNTTFYFRASATNLLSVEFLDIVRRHLNPGGVFFYNTTGSPRVQRTGCLGFSHGARFTNHMVLSDSPISWDFERWRRALESYRIDGKAIFDMGREHDRAQIDALMTWEADLGQPRGANGHIESCPDLIARTKGIRLMTDDNMGSEWRYPLHLE